MMQSGPQWFIPRRLVGPVVVVLGLALMGAYLTAEPNARALVEAFTLVGTVLVKNRMGPGRLVVMIHRHGGAAVAVGVVLLAAWRVGRRAGGWLARRGTGVGLERLVTRTALGLGGVSLAMLGLGLAGLLGFAPWVIAAGLLAPGGSGWARRRRSGGPVPWVFLLPLGLLLLTDLVACLSPEWFTDGQTYHLALPERFLLTHKVPILPENLLSFLPLNTEMAYAAVLAVARALGAHGSVAEEAAKMLNGVLGAGLAAAVTLVALRLGATRWAAAGGMLLFVAMPLTAVENEIAFADNSRALLETLAVLWILPVGRRRGSLALAGVFAGLAMGSKYLSVISGGALVVVVAVWTGRLPWRFLLVATMTLAPWLVRNALAGNDPVYPFLPAVFAPLRYTGEELVRWMADNRHYGLTDQTFGSWLALPWRFCRQLNEDAFGTFGGHPLLLTLAPLLLMRRGWTRAAAAVLVVFGIGALAWSLTSELARYLLPALALWCALLGWGLARLEGAVPRSRALVAGLLLFWSVPAGLLRIHHRINLDDTYGVLGEALGAGSDAAVRARRGFGPALDALPPGDLLFVGEDRPLGARRRWRAASVYNRSLLKTWAAESADARRFLLKVRQGGRFTAVILNGGMFEASQARGPGFRLTPRELAVVNPWWKRLAVAWRLPPWTGYAVR